ncbi:MAG: hypothetical protein WCC10_08290 [Tumebacillaceae bacterium]
MKQTACALVLGGFVNGYSIIRELSAKGVSDIWLFDTNKSLGSYSNKIKGFVLLDSTAQSLLTAIESLHQTYDKIVLFPTNDVHLEQLHELSDRIADYCFLPFHKHNLLQSLGKVHQYQQCEACGVPYPASVDLQRPEQLERVRELPYPVLIKPNKRDDLTSDLFRSLVLQSDEDLHEHQAMLSGYLAQGISFLASEIIPGECSNIFAYFGYRNKNGQILNEWIGGKLSQYPNRFGVFSTASNHAPREVLEQGRRLLEFMDLHGILEPEFKYDPRDGRYKLMEINLRSAMWNRVGYLTGVDIAHTQYLDALGEPVARQEQRRDFNLHYVYVKHELFGMLQGTISWTTFWHNLFASDQTCFAVFDPSDVKPFLVDFWRSTRGLFKGALKKLRTKKRKRSVMSACYK